MKIVLAHKFFHRVGGAEEYVRQQHRIMTGHGHEIVPFALRDPRNPLSEFDRYFLSPLELGRSGALYKLRHVHRIFARTLYSLEARRKMRALVRDHRPDVAHIHAIENHISPSILDELRASGVPIVQSVNNYKQLCTSYRLYLFDRGETCMRCRPGRYYPALLTRCLKGSLGASALGAIEMYLHQSILGIYRKVDRFIVPNDFVGERLVDAGHPREKIVRLRNPFDLAATAECRESGDFILYFGRLEPEKGVGVLLRAMQRLPRVRLVVVGDGSQRDACIEWARANRLENVEFVGPLWGDALAPYLAGCRLVVVPSIWYEPSPYVVYQALATGKPVVGSCIGGIPDLLTPATGCLVAPGDVDALADAVGALAGDAARRREMGRAARAWAEVNLDPRLYYEKMMSVYADVRERSGR